MIMYPKTVQFMEAVPKYKTAFEDYFNHVQTVERKVENLQFSNISLKDKEKVINELFKEELAKRTGMEIPTTIDGARRFAMNPNVIYYANEIIDQTIDMILPESLITSIGMIADIRYGGLMETFQFDIENNALFSVAKGGRRQRNAPAQVLEGATVTLAPENRIVTVKTTLPQILTDQKSIAKYIMKVMRSIESKMLYDTYDSFSATMNALAVPLKITGYTETAVIEACQRVTGWNQGRRAVIIGTAVALKSILPSALNTRILLQDEYVTLGHLREFNGKICA